MRLIDADYIAEGKVSNDPVMIATKCAPTIPAIPVEWLTDLIDRTAYADRSGNYKMWALHNAAYAVLQKWQEEQEART